MREDARARLLNELAAALALRQQHPFLAVGETPRARRAQINSILKLNPLQKRGLYMDRKSFLEASGLTIISLAAQAKGASAAAAPEKVAWYSLPEQILLHDRRFGADDPIRYTFASAPITHGCPVTFVGRHAADYRPAMLFEGDSFLLPTFDRRLVDENRLFVELASTTRTGSAACSNGSNDVVGLLKVGFRALESHDYTCKNLVVGPRSAGMLKDAGYLDPSANPHAFGKLWTATVFLSDWLPTNGALFFADPEFVGVMPIRQPEQHDIGMALINEHSLAYVLAV